MPGITASSWWCQGPLTLRLGVGFDIFRVTDTRSTEPPTGLFPLHDLQENQAVATSAATRLFNGAANYWKVSSFDGSRITHTGRGPAAATWVAPSSPWLKWIGRIGPTYYTAGMAMGRRKDRARTPGLWIATNELPAGHSRPGLGLAQGIRHLFLGEFRTLHRSRSFPTGDPQKRHRTSVLTCRRFSGRRH